MLRLLLLMSHYIFLTIFLHVNGLISFLCGLMVSLLRWCLELSTTRGIRLAPWGACCVIATREDRSAWLLLLETRLVEALCRHVEVLHL